MRLFAEKFTDCGRWDPRYWGYFQTFNEGRFYEAHDVLEDLWLECRGKPLDNFYKSLIQLAGIFVHIEKRRHRPALALLDICQGYLRPYGSTCEGLDLSLIHEIIDLWRDRIPNARQPDQSILNQYKRPIIRMPSPEGWGGPKISKK